METKVCYGKNTMLVVGKSKTDEMNAITLLYENLILVLVIEYDTGKILSAEANTICSNTKEFIASILVGKNLYYEMDELTEEIRTRYLGTSKRVLINCLKDAKNQILIAAKNLKNN